jgi:DNA polymerase III subunit gamma/tau
MSELYKKYRPKEFRDVIGQGSAVKVLEAKLKSNNLPHTLLFAGPSGCGKTTLARIVCRKLKCSKHDFKELNSADFRGIDMVRNIRININKAPIGGDCRVWLIDECHKLTTDAQNAFLKMLEDTPDHVYFMLATTEPQKLLPTIRTRSTEIAVKNLTRKSLQKLILFVSASALIGIDTEVLEKIIECSDGSARKALVLLDQIAELKSEEDMIEAIKATSGTLYMVMCDPFRADVGAVKADYQA